MFTGLVEAMGRIVHTEPIPEGRRVRIEAPFSGELGTGESVSVDGACLTVETCDEASFSVTAVAETLRRTVLGDKAVGNAVNLERSLRLSDRLGGHLVTGHIDAVGELEASRTGSGECMLTVVFPAAFRALVVDKGSIAVDGVSLTVVDVADHRFRVALIPETLSVTTLGQATKGDRVNLEFDLVAKYLLRFKECETTSNWMGERTGV